MIMRSVLHVLLCMALGLTYTPRASAGTRHTRIDGLWRTQDDKAKVKIYSENGVYSGVIMELKDPLSPDGAEKRDTKNPMSRLRSRPVVGIKVLWGLRNAGRNKWEGGKVYDPESGKTYRCALLLQADGGLKVRGSVGFSLIGRTRVWKRASDGEEKRLNASHEH